MAREAHHGLRVFHWPQIQGRGEFVASRWKMQAPDYMDVARGLESEGRDVPAMLAPMHGKGTSHIPFAPPFLRDGDMIVSHSAALAIFGMADRTCAN